MYLEHAFGGLGSLMLLVAYWLGSSGRLPVRGYVYQGINLVAAIILVIYSAIFGAWMVVALDLVWAMIAAATIWQVARLASRS